MQNTEIYLTIKISYRAGHIRLLGRTPEALARHVWPPGWTCLALFLILG
jgi:hypothetical protein